MPDSSTPGDWVADGVERWLHRHRASFVHTNRTPKGNRQRARFDGLPSSLPKAIAVLGARVAGSSWQVATYHVTNPPRRYRKLDEYVGWLIDTPHQCLRSGCGGFEASLGAPAGSATPALNCFADAAGVPAMRPLKPTPGCSAPTDGAERRKSRKTPTRTINRTCRRRPSSTTSPTWLSGLL